MTVSQCTIILSSNLSIHLSIYTFTEMNNPVVSFPPKSSLNSISRMPVAWIHLLSQVSIFFVFSALLTTLLLLLALFSPTRSPVVLVPLSLLFLFRSSAFAHVHRYFSLLFCIVCNKTRKYQLTSRDLHEEISLVAQWATL